MLEKVEFLWLIDVLGPPGSGLLDHPRLFWTQVAADLMIALAFFSIPVALITYAVRRRSHRYAWVLWMFGAFIVACGLTHLSSVYALWVPDYPLQAVLKGICALISLATAVMLWPLLPRALRMPTVEELEAEVERRTHDLKEANERLGEARDRAEAASAAKSVFLSTMSHELRTPLNAVVGFAELIERLPSSTGRSAKSVEYAREIRRSGLHLSELIADILDFATIESDHLSVSFRPVDTIDICRRAIRSVEAQAAKHQVAVALDIADDMALIDADPVRMTQILLNLMTNAVKYNRPGGEVVLSARQRGDRVHFAVRDTGIGIPADKLGRVFEPFDRLGRERMAVEGTGVGLALAARLARCMNSELTVESTEDVGSTFAFSMPVSASAKAARYRRPDCAASVLDAGAILAVEDNATNIKLLRRMIPSLIPRVRLDIVSSIDLAYDKIRTSPPDLLLLDLNLPDGSGFDLLSRVRGDGLTVPAIILTADATKATQRRADGFSRTRLVTKPMDQATLIAAINDLTDLSQAA